MSDIFISYVRGDLEAARRLAEALEAQGWSVFWDRMIPAGKTWREVIGAALANARCVVVLWSQHSVNSHWVLEEADQGLKRRVLIPAFIENVELPLGFGSIQAADLSIWDGSQTDAAIKGFFGDVAGILGPPPVEAKDGERWANIAGEPAAEANPPRLASTLPEAKPTSKERPLKPTPKHPESPVVTTPSETEKILGATKEQESKEAATPIKKKTKKKSANGKQSATTTRRRSKKPPVIHSKRILVDPNTGLMWTRKDNGENIDSDKASEYARKLKLGGYKDWRLPTIKELEGIYDPDNVSGYMPRSFDSLFYKIPICTINGFQLGSAWIWSGTVEAGDAWFFNFWEGCRVHEKETTYFNMRALCVRSLGE